MAGTQIKIRNPNGLKTIDYRTLNGLQGDLKDLKTQQFEQLKSILIEDGFDVPMYIWHNTADHKYYLLDGHQRLRVMTKEDMNDNGNYEVPYLIFEAADELAARKKLLRIASQFGTVTQEGFDAFVGEMQAFEGFDFDKSLANIHFDALSMPKFENQDQQKEKKETKERDGSTFSIKLGSQEECIQAHQALKSYAEMTDQDIEDIFVEIIEAGVEARSTGY